MSYPTIGSTIGEYSSISSFNSTKNPFDSGVESKLNLPALNASPSMFVETNTPGSPKKKEFRWSIDQMSKLDPADIDEFPNQDYNSMCDRVEDEERLQKEINEYFSHGTILPSPWTPDIKHVTFSPHPPSTAYISGDEDCASYNSDYSPSKNIMMKKNIVHAGCQTSLTFPPLFDLSKIVDSGFYSYMEDEGSSRDMNGSSLRRKLFSPDEHSSPHRSHDHPRCLPRRSILKSPSPSILVTSSPVNLRHNVEKAHLIHSHLTANASQSTSKSPAVSPIKEIKHIYDMSSLNIDGLSCDNVFNSDVLESSGVHIDSHLPPDVSPIKTADVHNQSCDGVKDDLYEDDGPMKISDLGHVSMELDNPSVDMSSSVMEISDCEPLTSTRRYTTKNYLESFEPKLFNTNSLDVSGKLKNSYCDDGKSLEQVGFPLLNMYPKEQEDIVKRACAAIKRADKLVQDLPLKQNMVGWRENNRELHSINHMKWSDYHEKHFDKNLKGCLQEPISLSKMHVSNACSLSQPMYMSTPVVNDVTNKNNNDHVIEYGTYGHHLNSLANSKLETSYLHSMNNNHRLKQMKMDKCIKDTEFSTVLNDDVYLSIHNGRRKLSKRFSWPLMPTAKYRNKYLNNLQAIDSLSSNTRQHSRDQRLRRSSSDDIKNYNHRYLRYYYR